MYLYIRLEDLPKPIYIEIIKETEKYYFIKKYPNLNIIPIGNLKVKNDDNLIKLHKIKNNLRNNLEILRVVSKVPPNVLDYYIYS